MTTFYGLYFSLDVIHVTAVSSHLVSQKMSARFSMASEPPSDKIMLMLRQSHVQEEVCLKILSMMDDNLNIATWNLCLAFSNKKDTVTSYLNNNNIKVCPENVLNCGGYNMELEQNSVKKRVGIYIQQELNYVRRTDLEKEDQAAAVIFPTASYWLDRIDVWDGRTGFIA